MSDITFADKVTGDPTNGTLTAGNVNEIKTAVNSKNNKPAEGAFVDGDKTKLNGIEVGADVTDAGNIGSTINGVAAKTTPVDADTIPLTDSADSSLLKKLSWTNIKATIKSYTDTLYVALTGTQTIAGNKTFTGDIDHPNSSRATLSSIFLVDAYWALGTRFGSNGVLGWGSTSGVPLYSHSTDAGITRLGAGVLQVNAYTGNPPTVSGYGSMVAGTFGGSRNTVANTAGVAVNFQGIGATSGATDKAGGDAVIAPGLSTGSGESGVIIKGCQAGSTGTVDGTLATVIQVLGNKMAFNGVTPITRPVFATGASHTVDELITVLQNLGLVSQS